jgi:hypothetical protein
LSDFYKGKYYYVVETSVDETTHNTMLHFKKPTNFEELANNCYEGSFID